MGDPYTLHFGLGNVATIDSVVVKWPVNPPVYETFEGLQVNHAYTLFEGGQTIITGQGEKQVLSSFMVYPNPAKDQFTVTGYLDEASEIELSISNITGKGESDIRPKGRIPAGPFSFLISESQLSKLVSGVYIICLKTGEVSHFKKLILIR